MAQLTLPELHKQASAAAAQLQPAQVEERQLGQGFAQQAPSLLQLAEALLQPVRECQRAAHGALPAMHQTQAALREVLDDSEVQSLWIHMTGQLAASGCSCCAHPMDMLDLW